MSNEPDELPRFLFTLACFRSPCRHRGPGNALLDCIEELAVGEALSAGLAHVRRGREGAPTDHRVAAPIVGMTDGAVVGEVFEALPQHLGRFSDRVDGVPRAARNEEAPSRLRHPLLEWPRLSFGGNARSAYHH